MVVLYALFVHLLNACVAQYNYASLCIALCSACQEGMGFQLAVPIWSLPLIIISCLLVVGVLIIALIRLIIYILVRLSVADSALRLQSGWVGIGMCTTPV